jgi:RHS repeat-associated protein
MLRAAKEEMPALPVVWGESVLPLVADPVLLENLIWGKSRVAENSRQGFQLRSSTLHWASSEVKSRTALGMRGTLYDEGIRSRCTGKERDGESNLDDFGARYYSSGYGRFMTPDWAAKPTAVPYANFGNPQSLNLYSYVKNNPSTMGDPDGHVGGADDLIEGAIVGITIAVMATQAYYAMPPEQRNFGVSLSQAAHSVASTISGFLHPDNSNKNVLPPPTVPTNVSQGTPASTSQQGTVNNGAINSTTLEPGPHAGEGVPARGPGRDFTPGERRAVNEQGRDTGCHTCGTTDPGTKSGNFVPDHQPPSALNPSGADQRLYPQCIQCSRTQGGEVNAEKHKPDQQ